MWAARARGSSAPCFFSFVTSLAYFVFILWGVWLAANSSVFRLIAQRYPAAVFLEVSQVVVDSIQTVPVRTIAHVLVEPYEQHPFFANANATLKVVPRMRMVWIQAPILHFDPRPVGARIILSMLGRCLGGVFRCGAVVTPPQPRLFIEESNDINANQFALAARHAGKIAKLPISSPYDWVARFNRLHTTMIAPLPIIAIPHAAQLQYLADSFVPGVSHPCRARKLFRFFAMCFLIGILGSPNRTSRTLPSSFASTADFLDAPGVALGLLYPANFWPR